VGLVIFPGPPMHNWTKGYHIFQTDKNEITVACRPDSKKGKQNSELFVNKYIIVPLDLINNACFLLDTKQEHTNINKNIGI
jgi:hypothetical protein